MTGHQRDFWPLALWTALILRVRFLATPRVFPPANDNVPAVEAVAAR